jgi:DNA polymerase-1
MRIQVADLEANGLLDSATTSWCGVFKDITTKEVYKFSNTHVGYVSQLLTHLDSVDVIIMHNGIGYDLPLLDKLYGYKFKGKVVDTVLMSRLLNPDRLKPFNMPSSKAGPHSLEAWGYRVGRGKPDHTDWTQYSDDMLHRCTEDVEITHLTYLQLMKDSKGNDWRDAYLLTFKLFEILHKQEAYGWLVDKGYMEKSIDTLSRWMDRIDRAVVPKLPKILVVTETKVKGEYRYVSKPFKISGQLTKQCTDWCDSIDGGFDSSNIVGCFSRIDFRVTDINSGAEVKQYLLGEGWIPDNWNYKKVNKKEVRDEQGNKIRTSPKLSYKDSFIGVVGSLGRLVSKRVQCRHRRSSIEGWIKLIRPDGRIGSRVSGIATTGRMKHAGIVNVPNVESFFGKHMRKCFISAKKMVLVGCDSAGCQNRMLAARVGDASFTDTLINGDKKKGTSIHHVNQKAILSVAGIDVSYGQAKTLNYAFMFGASDNKLGAILGSSKEVGTKIRQSMLSVAAGFEALVETLTREWKSNSKTRTSAWGKKEYYNGWIKGLDGRPIFIKSEHQILVYVLQSDEAIMMSAAYCMLYKRLNAKGYVWGRDYGIVCFYHDEYTIECREEIAKDVAKIAEQCIVDAGLFYNIACPHAGEAQIGNDWYEIH